MNLLLTCATIPEFSPEALDLWNRFCIAEYIQGDELIRYLLFASSSEFASIDAIVFLSPTTSVGFIQSTDGRLSPIPWTVWEGDFLNAELAERIRNLPESCAMRDGRKWKRIPQVVLSTDWHRPAAYDGLDVEFVVDTTEHMLHSGYSSPYTWNQIERIVNAYHQKAMSEYARVGFLVTDECGLYRVKRASRKKHSDESEFYFGGKDKRRFRGFVTIARERDGASYQALLFEELLNDPKVGEREFHRFFGEHPDFLAEAMMGVPVSHQPYFANKQTPDYAISPILPREDQEWVKLLEMKGPEASVLASRRYIHRGLAFDLSQALAQVRDYEESIRDPLNLKRVEKALGYIPSFAERAVLIGRNPPKEDADLWNKRKGEQLSVRIITYDELLQDHRERLRRRGGR